MKTRGKKEKKIATEIKKGDRIRVGDQNLVVRKADTVFYHTPDSLVRLELDIPGFEGNVRYKVILLFPISAEIATSSE